MRRQRAGFTLLEVIIALGILAGAMVVLVDNQALAVLSTREADRLITATNLAQEKMSEVQLVLEREGFGEMDIEENGDFADYYGKSLSADEMFERVSKYISDWERRVWWDSIAPKWLASPQATEGQKRAVKAANL